MKRLLTLSAILVNVSACVEQASAPEAAPVYRLTATITDDNHCTVNVLGKTYSSIGQVRGDQPSQFIGTLRDDIYHGFGCWVKAEGEGDGDLVVIFSGNNFGKPLDPGTYPLALELLGDTPHHTASVNFRPSEFGRNRLRTKDGAKGSVVVEVTPSGGRKITVDVETVRWGPLF